MATTDRAAADSLVARPSLRSLVDDLHERRARARLGGGEDKIARQHGQDKLTARERLALLIDEGTFVELATARWTAGWWPWPPTTSQ
jgi:acetyl-CoA carboxylase carboxyltransferase component